MSFSWPHLIIPGVLLNIFFLSVTSQWLFSRIEGFQLEKQQSYVFSFLCLNIFVSYVRCCITNPGIVPRRTDSTRKISTDGTQRWCRKCQNVKPPRAHHCSQCKRCIPKMDHHCIWIVNCISNRVFPHFFRVLFYNVIGMSYLQYFLLVRFGILWSNRHLPSYLGPSAFQLVHLLLLIISNSITFFALFLMFCKTIYSMLFNITTIEGWEIERHASLVKRARSNGGFVHGPNGLVLRIEKQEFPYDIGIWQNIVQSMGTSNFLAWFWSLSRSLPLGDGISFETNGFEDSSKIWPPPDPDKIPPESFSSQTREAAAATTPDYSCQSAIAAFRQRQATDFALKSAYGNHIHPRQRHAAPSSANIISDRNQLLKHLPSSPSSTIDRIWKSAEGERLGDFGVDEEEELYEDENIPLSELIQGRKG